MYQRIIKNMNHYNNIFHLQKNNLTEESSYSSTLYFIFIYFISGVWTFNDTAYCEHPECYCNKMLVNDEIIKDEPYIYSNLETTGLQTF